MCSLEIKYLQEYMYSEPSSRNRHFAACVGEKLYVWGGQGPGLAPSSSINFNVVETFKLREEIWTSVPTLGSLPPGRADGACTSASHSIYVYGGDLQPSPFYIQNSGSLFKYNTMTTIWEELSNAGPKVYGSRMIHYPHDDCIVLFGGCSSHEYNNDLHRFNLKSCLWLAPPRMTGCVPPISNYFSFTIIEDHRVILFGGFNGHAKFDDVYILDLTTWHWSKPEVVGTRPPKRSSHAAVCLGPWGDHPQLLIMEGRDEEYESMDDMWMLDLTSWRWTEIYIPDQVKQLRYGHCATSFPLSKNLEKVVLFGGLDSKSYTHLAKTSILLFGYTSSGRWSLIEATIHQGDSQTRICLKESVVSLTGKDQSAPHDLADLEQRVLIAEREKMEAIAAMEESSRRLAEAERRQAEAAHRAAESERRARGLEGTAEQAMERSVALERRVRECEEQLRRAGPHWVVDRAEIQLMGDEIGRGGWATVSIAKFRGVKVAAKSIHNHIISSHNRRLFKREMDMAARIRHPNLVQFIGATQEGPLVILMELIPTSLRRELEREEHSYLSPRTVTSIGLDVARGLNYLHLMQPDPIIHRDISSANVLLQPLPNGCWKAKVSDYGTVNLLQELQTICPGNPTYAAPEATDPTKQSPAMDIFSFGILLVEMLTGELPPVDERQELVACVRHPILLALVQRCLSEEGEQRPSALAIITELDD